MENPGSEMNDWEWEVVQSSNSDEDQLSSVGLSPSSPGGGGVIQSDYFSLDSELNYAAASANDAAAVAAEVGSNEGEEGESDNPSWVDPSGSSVVGGSIGGGRRKRSRSPNSSSPSSDSDSSGRSLTYLLQPHSDCCGGGFDCQNEKFSRFEHLGFSDNFPNSQEIDQNNGGNWSDSGGNDVEVNSVTGECHDALGSDKGEADEGQKQEEDGVNEQLSQAGFEQEEEMNREENDDEKKRVVWWKVPLEVLRYCVLRVSPVWSLSMAAAAVMGFVLLRRRYLYKLKRKTLGIQLNVTVDDKKVSQFMSRAARLNEAFSVVKRVPIIRPALPAPGMAPWPVMSLR